MVRCVEESVIIQEYTLAQVYSMEALEGKNVLCRDGKSVFQGFSYINEENSDFQTVVFGWKRSGFSMSLPTFNELSRSRFWQKAELTELLNKLLYGINMYNKFLGKKY